MQHAALTGLKITDSAFEGRNEPKRTIISACSAPERHIVDDYCEVDPPVQRRYVDWAMKKIKRTNTSNFQARLIPRNLLVSRQFLYARTSRRR